MPQINVIALHDGPAVTAALKQAVAVVEAAEVPQHLRRDAFALAFTALTARHVELIPDNGMPVQLPPGLKL